MAPIKHGQLTRFVKAGTTCSALMYNGERCGSKTWQECLQCEFPICSRHIVGHYRKQHPKSI